MQTLGFDHAILSARLLDHWGLPDAIVRAVAQPHDADRILALPIAERALPQVLHLAELIAQLLAGQKPLALERLHDAGQKYGLLSLDELPALLDTLDEKVQQLATALRLNLDAPTDCRAVLAAAHAQPDRSGGRGGAGPARRRKSLAGNRRLDAIGGPVCSSKRCGISNPRRLPPRQPVRRRRWRTHDRARATTEEPGLLGRVSAAAANCRQARRPLSLLLLAIDHFDEWILTVGQDATSAVVRHVAGVLRREIDPPRSSSTWATGDSPSRWWTTIGRKALPPRPSASSATG